MDAASRESISLFESLFQLSSRSNNEQAQGARHWDFTIYTCVLDTNAILGDIKHHLKTGRKTALLEGMLLGGTRAFISPSVRAEVPEKIPEVFPQKIKFDPIETQAVWEDEYLPRITVLDPSALSVRSDRLEELAKRDPDDVPTGQLVELIGPHAVLSTDKDLNPFEITGENWSIITCAYRDKSRHDAVVIGVQYGGGTVIYLGTILANSLITTVLRLDRRLQHLLMISCAMLIGTIAAALCSQRALRQRLFRFARTDASQFGTRLSEVALHLADLFARGQEAERRLVETHRPYRMPKSALDHLIVALSRAPGPLTPWEISQGMITNGYTPRGSHPEQYVRNLLGKWPALFQEQDGRRWWFATTPNQRYEASR